MSILNAKTTIYLEPTVKQFIQHKAVSESRSVSEVINDHFADMLEDLVDAKVIGERRQEPAVPFETVLREAGLTYDDLRD